MRIRYNQEHIGNVKISTLCVWMLSLGFIFFIFSIIGIVMCTYRYKNLIKNTDYCIMAQTDIKKISVFSNYLTDQARQFVVTRDINYVNNYFNELNMQNTKSDIIGNLRKYIKTPDNALIILIEKAFADSDDLRNMELHAMKLVALFKGYSTSILPDELNNYPLSEKEVNDDKSEMLDNAYNLIFSQNYSDTKNMIDKNIGFAANHLYNETKNEQNESIIFFRNALVNQIIAIAILLIILIISFLLITIFILHPLNVFLSCIKREIPLAVIGTYEFRHLARTYNKMYEINKSSKTELQHQASYDSLTGLLNRISFDQMCAYYKGAEFPLALLLIDVDSFKGINDNFGHEMGDDALKVVAKLLKNYFRANDNSFRIGGDEFAIIMTDITESSRNTIAKKIDNINEILAKPDSENLPKLSISVGIAFSPRGYCNEIFSHADVALYSSKRDGKCGYTFYESDTETYC